MKFILEGEGGIEMTVTLPAIEDLLVTAVERKLAEALQTLGLQVDTRKVIHDMLAIAYDLGRVDGMKQALEKMQTSKT